MNNDSRFISFSDRQGIEHTYLIADIQAVGIPEEGSTANPYIRAFDFALVVPRDEAIRVRQRWVEDD